MGVILNRLLQKWPYGGVVTSPWLHSLGVSNQLLKKYTTSHWLNSLGYGAYKRTGDTITWEGALNAIQTQLGKDLHIAGKTALELQGKAHFIPAQETQVILFSPTSAKLPKWLHHQDFNIIFEAHKASFLESDEGIASKRINGFELKISTAERAILEVLYLAPQHQSLQESKYLLENLTTLRPRVLQGLLDACTSIKVNRLFLLLAEHLQLPCVKHLNLDNVKLGSGNRSLIKGGQLHNKYKITIPHNLLTDES